MDYKTRKEIKEALEGMGLPDTLKCFNAIPNSKFFYWLEAFKKEYGSNPDPTDEDIKMIEEHFDDEEDYETGGEAPELAFIFMEQEYRQFEGTAEELPPYLVEFERLKKALDKYKAFFPTVEQWRNFKLHENNKPVVKINGNFTISKPDSGFYGFSDVPYRMFYSNILHTNLRNKNRAGHVDKAREAINRMPFVNADKFANSNVTETGISLEEHYYLQAKALQELSVSDAEVIETIFKEFPENEKEKVESYPSDNEFNLLESKDQYKFYEDIYFKDSGTWEDAFSIFQKEIKNRTGYPLETDYHKFHDSFKKWRSRKQ